MCHTRQLVDLNQFIFSLFAFFCKGNLGANLAIFNQTCTHFITFNGVNLAHCIEWSILVVRGVFCFHRIAVFWAQH